MVWHQPRWQACGQRRLYGGSRNERRSERSSMQNSYRQLVFSKITGCWPLWLLYLAINSLFVLKYISRISVGMGIVATAVYMVGVMALIVFLKKWRNPSRKTIMCITVIAGAILLIAQSSIDPYKLQVDRWSAIHNFLNNLFHGIYPYAARTHLGGYGSPFPFWQCFHIPFYLLGNVGLSIFFCLFLYIASVYRYVASAKLLQLIALLFSSPAFVYEVMVRSDLLSNFLLVAAIINYIYYHRIYLLQHWLPISMVIGLMLSTRLSAAIPFAVYFLYSYLRQPAYIKVMMPVVVFVTSVVTFLPFVFWNGRMLFFFQYNPFVLQTRQGSLMVVVIIACLLIYLSLTWKNSYYKMERNIAIVLFGLVAVTFIYNMFTTHTWTELFQSRYDISYFDMALPFLCLGISMYRDHSYPQLAE